MVVVEAVAVAVAVAVVVVVIGVVGGSPRSYVGCGDCGSDACTGMVGVVMVDWWWFLSFQKVTTLSVSVCSV